MDDVSGSGLETAVVKWHIPPHDVSHRQDRGAMGQFVMLTIVLLSLASALGVLGWVVSRITVLLFGSPSGGGGVSGIAGLAPIAAIGAVAYFVMSKRGQKHG